MSDMDWSTMSGGKCGMCVRVCSMLRRALCMSSRRNSTDSYYYRLGDQETLRLGDDASTSSQISEDNDSDQALIDAVADHHFCPNIFDEWIMRRTPRRRRLCDDFVVDMGLVDELLIGQTRCHLRQAENWDFDPFALHRVADGHGLAELCIHLFHQYNLFRCFNIDIAKAWKLFTLVERGYLSRNPFHNNVHAIDVTQAMHCFLQQEKILENITPFEIMACLLAAIGHDLDHPGVNQSFLIETGHFLAGLYRGQSVLENHHFRTLVSYIIESGICEDARILREELIEQINTLIMATDIGRQEEYLSQFSGNLETGMLDMSRRDIRRLVLQIALKCADISNPCRDWGISRIWSERICDEFFHQGDMERDVEISVTSLCDRYNNSVAQIQIGFFQMLVRPLIIEWDRFLNSDLSRLMLNNLNYNLTQWETYAVDEMLSRAITEAELDDDEDDDTKKGDKPSQGSTVLAPSPELMCRLMRVEETEEQENERLRLMVELDEMLEEREILLRERADLLAERAHWEEVAVPSPQINEERAHMVNVERAPMVNEERAPMANEERSEEQPHVPELLTEPSEMYGGRADLFSEPSDIFSDLSERDEATSENSNLLSRALSASELPLAGTFTSRDRNRQFIRTQTFPPFDYTENRLNDGTIAASPQGLANIASSDSDSETEKENNDPFITNQRLNRRESEPANEIGMSLIRQPLLRRMSAPTESSTKNKNSDPGHFIPI